MLKANGPKNIAALQETDELCSVFGRNNSLYCKVRYSDKMKMKGKLTSVRQRGFDPQTAIIAAVPECPQFLNPQS